MANVLVEEKIMTDIANAIREKSGTDVKMKPAEMPETIREMEVVDTGVGSRQWWLDVCSQKKAFGGMFEGCHITTIPLIDTSKAVIFNNMFTNCKSLITIPLIDTSKSTGFNAMFYGCKSLTTIPQLDLSNGVNFGNMFYNCTALITIPKIDISKATNVSLTFSGCISLENITFVAECIKLSISFIQSPLLSDESIQSIIDGLADLTGQTAQTITFHPTVKNKLTEEQIASATSKNWNIA